MSGAEPSGGVRRAGPRDLEALRRLWTQIADHHASLDPLFRLRPGAAPTVRSVLAATLRERDAAVFVFERAGDLVGLCIVRVERAPAILEEEARAEITELGVREDARRRGIGAALVAEALAWLRERGIERVEVRVARVNREGQGFWRAQGFGDLIDVLHRRL